MNTQYRWIKLCLVLCLITLILTQLSACATFGFSAVEVSEKPTLLPEQVPNTEVKVNAVQTELPEQFPNTEMTMETTELHVRPTYINEHYGFEFTYAENWDLEETDHAVTLQHDNLILGINFAWSTEDIGPGLFGRTGVGAGDFTDVGQVSIMGQMVPVQTLEYKGKIKAVFYNGTSLMKVNDLVFMIVLEDLSTDYVTLDIPEAEQAEATEIVTSLKCVEAHNSGSNQD